MIWYVATLIASVFSTRGTAAQGELKCNLLYTALSFLSFFPSPVIQIYIFLGLGHHGLFFIFKLYFINVEYFKVNNITGLGSGYFKMILDYNFVFIYKYYCCVIG